MRLASITVNSKNKAEAIIKALHEAKRGGYYETFIDDKIKASYVIFYNNRRATR